MKTRKEIAVGLAAALAIAMFAAGAVSTVTVSAFDVNIDIIETDFGQVLPGQVTEMHSFDVISDANAIVEARFLTSEDGVYGFTGGSVSVIPAENFTINGTALNNNGNPMVICIVESGVTKAFHTKLHVPPGQTGADYSGIVELTFTADVADEDNEDNEDNEDTVVDEDNEVIVADEDNEVIVADEDNEVIVADEDNEVIVDNAPEIP